MASGTAPRVLIGSRASGGSAVADAVRLVETHDLVAPAAVQASTSATPDSLAFSWPASHDNIGVGAYQLWVDRQRVYEGDALAYTTSALPCGSSHLISLRTVDLAGNRSPAQRFTAATDPCPNPVTDLQVTATGQTTVTLSWQSGGGSVSGYKVCFRGGAYDRADRQSQLYRHRPRLRYRLLVLGARGRQRRRPIRPHAHPCHHGALLTTWRRVAPAREGGPWDPPRTPTGYALNST